MSRELEMLHKKAEALNTRFTGTDDPFRIVTRLLEECGELAAEVNHAERAGVKTEKNGEPDRARMAKEMLDVLTAVAALSLHYGLQGELSSLIREHYERVLSEGMVVPLTST